MMRYLFTLGLCATFSLAAASFINSSQDSGERGKARSKRSVPNDEFIAEGAMNEEEDRYGKAAAGRIPDEFMKEAANAADPQIYNLSNGVKAYVQDYEGETCSLRVVLRNASQEEVLFGMDGSFDESDPFFSSCRQKIGNSSIELAVIAVGDFPADAMRSMIVQMCRFSFSFNGS